MNRLSHLYARYFRLTFLNILANITVPLVGLVDIAMLGHLPDIRFMAGVALVSILFDYLFWSFGFLRMGTTGTAAQAVGRADRNGLFLVLYRALLLAGLIGGALLILQYPLREAGFLLLSGEAGVEDAGRAYFNARIWGAPAALLNFAFLGWYLGREESHNVLLMTAVANLANIGLNYLFIIRLEMAAFGAGLASMLSQYLMLGTALWILFLKKPIGAWHWPEVMDRGEIRSMFRLNRDILVRTLGLITAFALFTNFSSLLGTAVLAANTILLKLQTLAAYLIDGAAFASESLAGVFRGEKNAAALRRLFRLSLITGELFALLFLGLFLLSPATYFGIMTSHESLIELAGRFGPWLLPVLLFGAPAYMYDGLFLGLTMGKTLRNSMFFSTLLGFLPLALLALYLRNNHLLWGAMTLFMIVRATTLWAASRNLRPLLDRTAPGD
ncbi:MAG: MATE family efflux transporter [Acidobacteria bacterium]|nr:MATE family efflux transporter [Acidobacteriota bacterium]